MGAILKNFLTLSILLIATTAAAKKAEPACISHADLEGMAKNFDQFQKFLGKKDQYCKEDLGEQWITIANSLVVLKDIHQNTPTYESDDALTYQAITEKDWWSYFIKRANHFTIQTKCQQYVVAYVMPFFGAGDINLCPMFFDQDVTSQASVMMHEVRHFDGFPHVSCSQGNEKGMSGACDDAITTKGSYAISVQTLVGMARSKDIATESKPVVEAEAVYMAFNKFNKVPEVRLNQSIILSSDQGEVFNWSLDAGVTEIGKLPEPSIVLNSAGKLTIYPLDTNSEAYRKDNKLFVEMDNPGLYAKHYNAETPEERAKYKAISYFPTGGLLKENSLLTLCGSDLSANNLDDKGEFSTIISMSMDPKDQKRESLLLATTGELYRFECSSPETQSDEVRFEKTEMVFNGDANQIADSFGLAGQQYAVMKDGSLTMVEFNGNNLQISPMSLPSVKRNWVSATPMSTAEVF